ncbi:MAG: lipocalin family protein [Shewanellaceae bacterium]|nr:lipocalin family protein [Shewanellaceae bacterium]
MHIWSSLFIPLMLLMVGCTGLPEGIEPVNAFNQQRYLGTWYEVARLDHGFERGLSNVTAQYQVRDDGGILVTNRGYNVAEAAWQQATGYAESIGDPNQGHLKVSFFRPFYSSYVIFYLDPQYQYAFISGFNRDYLWLLARRSTVPTAVKQKFLQRATALGFAVDELIWVSHQPRS